MGRALATAGEIASYHSRISVEVADEFTDMDFGKWQGLTVREVEAQFPDSYRLWVRKPEQADIAGGENLRRVRKRALAGLKRIASLHPEATVAVVSHGVVNKVLLCAVLGAPVSAFWKVKQDTGALNLFEYSVFGTKVFLMNYVSHLASIPDVISGMSYSRTPVGLSTDDERQNGA
jgi:broad specificity phosphatase PhoE